MSTLAQVSGVAVLFLSAVAVAQTEPSPIYRNADWHFAVIFPTQPMARDISYTTKEGTSVPGRQFYVEQGNDQYRLTLVKFANAAAIDRDIIEHAAQQLLKKGMVRFQFSNCY